eukprot:365308-Chlamydomonas_euryale.AAC.1
MSNEPGSSAWEEWARELRLGGMGQEAQVERNEPGSSAWEEWARKLRLRGVGQEAQVERNGPGRSCIDLSGYRT